MSAPGPDVRRIARLARLRLSDDEVRLFGGQLGRILEAIAELSTLDASGAPDLPLLDAGAGAGREDEPRPFAGRERLLANAPERDGPYFKTRKAVE